MLTTSEASDFVADQLDEAFCRPLDRAENCLTFAGLRRCDGENVLDLGCGTGLCLEYRSPTRYSGIDVSQGMLRRAIEIFGDCPRFQFYHRPMAYLSPLPGSPFDTMVVNPVTNKVHVANGWASDNVTVITPAAVQAIPLTVTITPLPGNATASPTPSFTFSASSTYSPATP